MIEDRNIRIFLSSTFADMQEERNYLVKKIFPAVYAECKKRNVELSVIDLRWGITEEESKTGKVIEICLDEIERTRPFFIGIVGGRYGWIPRTEDLLKNQHLSQKYPMMSEYIKEGKSITEIEMLFGALNKANRVQSFFFMRDLGSVSDKYIEETNSSNYRKLLKLRENIETAAEQGICSLKKYDTVAALGQLVYLQLIELINNLFPDKEQNQWERISNIQLSAVRKHRYNYIERDVIINEDKVISHIPQNIFNAEDQKCAVIYGESGTGKSAFASAELDFESEELPVIWTTVDDEIDSLDSLERLFLYNTSRYTSILDHCSQSENDMKITSVFQQCQIDHKIIWVIDNIELLANSEEKSLLWLLDLPTFIFPVIVTSSKPIVAKIKSIYNNSSITTFEVKTLEPSRIMAFLSAHLKELSKALTTKQLSHICKNPVLSNARFLKVFIHEISQFGEYERLDEYIDKFIDANNLTDFIDVLICQIERDFGEKTIRDFLSTILLSEMGVKSEDMQNVLNLRPIDYVSLFNAVSPLLSNYNKFYKFSDSSIKEAVGRHLNLKKASEDKYRKTIIKFRKAECEGHLKNLNLNIKERFFIWLMNADVLYFGKEETRAKSEIVNQTIKLGDSKKAYSMFKHFGILLTTLDTTFLPILSNNKKNISGLISILKLQFIYLFYRKEFLEYIPFLVEMFNSFATEEQKKKVKKKIKMLVIPQTLKEKLIGNGVFAPSYDFNTFLYKCRSKDESNINDNEVKHFIHDVVYTYDIQVIKKALQAIRPIADDLRGLEEPPYNHSLPLCLMCCYCFLRLDNYQEGIDYYTLAERFNPYAGEQFVDIKYLLSLKNRDFDACKEILLKFQNEEYEDYILSKLKFTVTLWDALEKPCEEIINYIRSKKSIRNPDIYYSAGFWLGMWSKEVYAKECFMMALNISDTLDERLACLKEISNFCDRNEKVKYLKERYELVCQSHEDTWADNMHSPIEDYVIALRKHGDQEEAIKVIDCILKRYGNITSLESAQLYNLKGVCLDDLYQKSNKESLFNESLSNFNLALYYVDNSTMYYYVIIANRLLLLTRKRDSKSFDKLIDNSQEILEGLINNNTDIDGHILSCLLELYLQSNQLDKALSICESSSSRNEIPHSQIHRLRDSLSNDNQLLEIAQEKISKFRELLSDGNIFELIKWIVGERDNDYNFGFMKIIINSNIEKKKDIAINKMMQLLIERVEGCVTYITDEFYKENLFEPDMNMLLALETNMEWSNSNQQYLPSEFNEDTMREFSEKARAEVLKIAQRKLLSMCGRFNLSNDDYVKIFVNYADLLDNSLGKLLDIIEGRNDAIDCLINYLKCTRYKYYDLCSQLLMEINRIRTHMLYSSTLGDAISGVIDDCAYDMFCDGEKALYGIEKLVAIAESLNISSIGNYTMYMIISDLSNKKDWENLLPKAKDFSERCSNSTIRDAILGFESRAYANLGCKEEAGSIILDLIHSSEDLKVAYNIRYGNFLLQYAEYQKCNDYIYKYYCDNSSSFDFSTQLSFAGIISTAKLYLDEYEEALRFINFSLNDGYDNDDEKKEAMLQRACRLIIFYARQNLIKDALELYNSNNIDNYAPVRVYIELSRMYKRLGDYNKSEEMKQEAIKSMNLDPYYLKEYELFLATE